MSTVNSAGKALNTRLTVYADTAIADRIQEQI